MRRTALLLLLCTLSATLGTARRVSADEVDPADGRPGSYVTVNVGVELHAIERAASEVAASMAQLAKSVEKLATSPSLSDEEKAELMAVIARVDTLSDRVVHAIDRLPAAVEDSRRPLTDIASALASDVRLTVVITLALVLLVILGALWGIFAFVLKPSRKMVTDSTARIVGLVDSLERAAELVAQTNATQVELTRALDALHRGPGVAEPREPASAPLPPTPPPSTEPETPAPAPSSEG